MKSNKYKRDLSRLRRGINRNHSINLSYLYLGNLKVLKLLEELKKHPEVTSLDLSANNITNEVIPSLCANPHLFEIKLASNRLNDDVGKDFKNSKTLEILDLSNNFLGNPCVEFLAKNQSITVLDLSYNNIDNINPFRNHQKLTVLDVCHNPVDDKGFENLNTHPVLQVLDIGTTQVTENGLSHFFSSRSGITKLITSGNIYQDDEKIEMALEEFGRKNFIHFAITVFTELYSCQIPGPLAALIFGYMTEVIYNIARNLSATPADPEESSSPAVSYFSFFSSLGKLDQVFDSFKIDHNFS